MRKLQVSGFRWLIHIAVLLPLAVIIWDLSQGQLSVNPIEQIQRRTGKSALVLLVLSLACRPIGLIPGLKWVLQLRRPLGLYAFTYVTLHLLNFIGLDYGFDFALLREDIAEKRFVFVGLAAFLVLLPVALTSTRSWMRRLSKNWERLHRLVYLAALLAVTHFLLQVKADFREPLIYGMVVLVLLLFRIPVIRKVAGTLRRRTVEKLT